MATPVVAAPTVSLDGPLPQPRPYSLLESAGAPEVSLTEGDYRELAGGASLWLYSSDKVRLWEPCAAGTFADKDFDADNDQATFGPFGVYLPASCSAIDATREELEGRARTAFTAVESEAVERQLTTGEVNDNPFLADSNAQVITGTHPAREGLALLERAIAASSGLGVIHADPGIVTLWDAALKEEGRVLRTRASSTLVISGAGYLGTEPEGEAAATATTGWAYATGPLAIARSSITVLFSFDHAVNDGVAVAERNYIVTWDVALQAAVLIDLTS